MHVANAISNTRAKHNDSILLLTIVSYTVNSILNIFWPHHTINDCMIHLMNYSYLSTEVGFLIKEKKKKKAM